MNTTGFDPTAVPFFHSDQPAPVLTLVFRRAGEQVFAEACLAALLRRNPHKKWLSILHTLDNHVQIDQNLNLPAIFLYEILFVFLLNIDISRQNPSWALH